MTDNVQKIKKEIKRLKHLPINAYDKSRFTLLLEIEDFIDSLPKQSASKDRINECPYWDKDWGCDTSPMNRCDICPHAKWVEVKDEQEKIASPASEDSEEVQLIKEEIERLKIKNEIVLDKEHTQENKWYKIGAYDICFQLLHFIDSIQEEPKCIYNRTLEERKESCKYCSAACDVWIKKEPTSTTNEDLEEAASLYCHNLKNIYNGLYGYHITDAFKAGVEWQKKNNENI